MLATRRLPVMRSTWPRCSLQEVAEVRRDLEREESVDLGWRGAEFQPTVDIGVKKPLVQTASLPRASS